MNDQVQLFALWYSLDPSLLFENESILLSGALGRSVNGSWENQSILWKNKLEVPFLFTVASS